MSKATAEQLKEAGRTYRGLVGFLEELVKRHPELPHDQQQAAGMLFVCKIIDQDRAKREAWEAEQVRHAEATAKNAEVLVRLTKVVESMQGRIDKLEDAWSRRHEP